MKDVIYNERMKELNFEFHDIFDLRRLGLVQKIFQVNLQAKKAIYDSKFELYPIPRCEMDFNPLAKQNPGW